MYHGVAMGAATPTVTPPMSRVPSVGSNDDDDYTTLQQQYDSSTQSIDYNDVQQQHDSSTQSIDYNDAGSPGNKVTTDSKSSRAGVAMSPPTAPGDPPAANVDPAALSGRMTEAPRPQPPREGGINQQRSGAMRPRNLPPPPRPPRRQGVAKASDSAPPSGFCRFRRHFSHFSNHSPDERSREHCQQ